MEHLVIYGARATQPERTAAEDLRRDLEQVVGRSIRIAVETEDLPEKQQIYLVGSPSTSDWIDRFTKQGDLEVTADTPGPQGGWIKRIDREDGTPFLVLAGSDPAGVQRAVYEFSHKALGVDPARYFTNLAPARRPSFEPSAVDQRIDPPRVPIRCYFDNDNDELANLSEPLLQFDMATWHGVFETLNRLGYNAIDIHDHLGRSEFYRWDYYKELRPDFHVDLAYLQQVIDLAHSRGLMVQVPMYLCWEFKHINEEEAGCWTKFKERWIETWRYYMKETPIGDCDIFLNRPRSQLWDAQYRSACGEDVPSIMTEAFTAMHDVILEHNAKAILVCDLYTHGMKVWESGRFNPPHDFIMAWPNNQYGGFAAWPGETRDYRFGLYMHAGFWLNHVVPDPYPERIATSMKTALMEKGFDHYCLVNAQTFRHFLLNLEAYARACEDPEHFHGEAFYREWTTRYFGPEASDAAIAALTALHTIGAGGEGTPNQPPEARAKGGYIKIMHSLMNAIDDCQQAKIYDSLEEAQVQRHVAREQLQQLHKALEHALQAEASAGLRADLAHDQLVLPIRLFTQTMDMLATLYEALLAWNEYARGLDNDRLEDANNYVLRVKELLDAQLRTRRRGDRDPKWAGWYRPDRRRPNGGFPTFEDLDKIRFTAREPVGE